MNMYSSSSTLFAMSGGIIPTTLWLVGLFLLGYLVWIVEPWELIRWKSPETLIPKSVKISGCTLIGDTKVPPTTLRNIIFLKKFVWVHGVFKVSQSAARAGYRVGYIAYDGTMRVCSSWLHDQSFRVRIGHEHCTFFAIDGLGNEIPLTLVVRCERGCTKHNKIHMI